MSYAAVFAIVWIYPLLRRPVESEEQGHPIFLATAFGQYRGTGRGLAHQSVLFPPVSRAVLYLEPF